MILKMILEEIVFLRVNREVSLPSAWCLQISPGLSVVTPSSILVYSGSKRYKNSEFGG